MIAHNNKIFSRVDLRIVKGGSWYDGLAYAQIGSRQGIPKDTKSMKIGFRIAATIVKGDVKEYLPKENIR